MKNIKSRVLLFLFVSVFSVFGSGVFALNTVYATVSQCYSADFPNRIIVEFDGEKIRSDITEAEAFKTEPVSLVAGTYDIILVASDGYPDRVNVSQPNESWKLILKNGVTEIGTTGATPDLVDLVESATETLNINNFVVSSAVDTAVAYHAVYPDTSSANSVQPVCAGFDLIPPPTATIEAVKIICPTEDLLPNWGAGGADITSATASDFIAENPTCYTEDWTFEWAPNGTSNPGDQTGAAGGDWITFSSTATVPTGALIWVREQFNNDYISFSGDTTEPQDQNVSAEFYCDNDVLNYDNYDFIDPVETDQTYYCVGFNVPINSTPEDPQCSDGVDNSDSEDTLADTLDPGCHSDGNADNSSSYDPEDDDESNGDGGGGGGGGSSSGSRIKKPAGQVLGAQTSCGIYVDKYLRKGYKNDVQTVKKVQQFLNDYMKTKLEVDGIYGSKTEEAVRAFQLLHKDKILTPWGISASTGIFYLTTLTEVNNIMCPDLNLSIPSNLVNFTPSVIN